MRSASALRAAVCAAILAATPVLADDSADILFWTSIQNSADPAEFKAYLRAFPDGKFAALARIRGGVPSQAQPTDGGRNERPAAQETAATLVVSTPTVRAIDRIAVDIDARGLRSASNHRVLVVPAGTPDALDPETIAERGTAISAARLRLTLPPAEPGAGEVRIYAIPQFSRAFEIAARAPVEVTPGPVGAVVVERLTREARAIGAVAFEAKYRDVPLSLTGQFLRMTSGTTEMDWVSLLGGRAFTPADFVVVYVGHLGTPADGAGPSEIACVMEAEGRGALDRLAAMAPGDELVLDGAASTWGAARGSEFVVVNPCRFRS